MAIDNDTRLNYQTNNKEDGSYSDYVTIPKDRRADIVKSLLFVKVCLGCGRRRVLANDDNINPTPLPISGTL